jgi:hypothetical protein
LGEREREKGRKRKREREKGRERKGEKERKRRDGLSSHAKNE